METRELFIKVLNGVIKGYKTQKGLPVGSDVVVDYIPEECKIASYLDRHPGWIKLPVVLKEGTGYVFLSTKWSIRIKLAWEEDDRPYELSALIVSCLVGGEYYITDSEYDKLKKLILNIVSQALRSNL